MFALCATVCGSLAYYHHDPPAQEGADEAEPNEEEVAAAAVSDANLEALVKVRLSPYVCVCTRVCMLALSI